MSLFTDTTTIVGRVLKGRPILAIFEVCLRCNSACGYCDLPLNEGRYEMTREEIHRVFRHLYTEGLRFVFVQGGEPLVRRDLPEILGDLAGLGFHLTLITNGTKLTQELVDHLTPLHVNLSISLDTLDRERYQHIRGRDQLPEVLSGIERLKAYSHPKYLTCIVTEQNRQDVMEVVRFARTKGFMPVVGAYHWDVARYGKIDSSLQYERSAAQAVFQEVIESHLVPSGYFRRYLQDNIDWLEGKSLAPCDAGKYSISIDASGHVAPCLALNHAGNLLHQTLPEILSQFDRKNIRTCSEHSTCNMLCSRVIGSALRHPLTAVLTPNRLKPMEGSYAR